MEKNEKFFDLLCQGKVTEKDIDNHIKAWRKSCISNDRGNPEVPVHEYLGMAKKDYTDWRNGRITLSALACGKALQQASEKAEKAVSPKPTAPPQKKIKQAEPTDNDESNSGWKWTRPEAVRSIVTVTDSKTCEIAADESVTFKPTLDIGHHLKVPKWQACQVSMLSQEVSMSTEKEEPTIAEVMESAKPAYSKPRQTIAENQLEKVPDSYQVDVNYNAGHVDIFHDGAAICRVDLMDFNVEPNTKKKVELSYTDSNPGALASHPMKAHLESLYEQLIENHSWKKRSVFDWITKMNFDCLRFQRPVADLIDKLATSLLFAELEIKNSNEKIEKLITVLSDENLYLDSHVKLLEEMGETRAVAVLKDRQKYNNELKQVVCNTRPLKVTAMGDQDE